MDELVGAEAASAHGKPIARKQKLDALRRTIIDIAASGQQKKATGTLYDQVKMPLLSYWKCIEIGNHVNSFIRRNISTILRV